MHHGSFHFSRLNKEKEEYSQNEEVTNTYKRLLSASSFVPLIYLSLLFPFVFRSPIADRFSLPLFLQFDLFPHAATLRKQRLKAGKKWSPSSHHAKNAVDKERDRFVSRRTNAKYKQTFTKREAKEWKGSTSKGGEGGGRQRCFNCTATSLSTLK